MDASHFYTALQRGQQTSPEICLQNIIPQSIMHYLKTEPDIWICGGSILGMQLCGTSHLSNYRPNDIDFYFSKKEIADTFTYMLKLEGYNDLYRTDNAITFECSGKIRMQAIINPKYLANPNIYAVLGQFDFYNCMLCNKDSKALRYNINNSSPLYVFRRLKKYIAKGFHIDKYNLMLIYIKLLSLYTEDVVFDYVGQQEKQISAVRKAIHSDSIFKDYLSSLRNVKDLDYT